MNDILRQELSPAVVVAIGGKDYSLVYDLQATILYKQKTAELYKTGESLYGDHAFSKLNPVNDPGLFAACLWAGLQRKHPEITFEQLGEMIPFGPAVNPLIVAVSKALTAHFPKEKAKGPNAAAPAEGPAAPIENEPIQTNEPEKIPSPNSAPLPVSISA
jgi:hypothetical protein